MKRINGSVVTATIGGEEIRFFVANERDAIQKHHAAGEFYEAEEIAIIARYLPPGAHYVDIGANVGNHAVYVSKFLAPAGVVVIEPNPPAIEILRLNLLLNDLASRVDASLLGFGLAEAEGMARAVVPPNNLGGSGLVLDAAGATIPLRRGDDLLAGRRIDFIKLDVEGMELGVLAGLEGLIATWRPRMFIEVHNRNAAPFRQWLARLGYGVRATFRRYPSNENFMVVPE
jgi:FkbM family methyltransferase